MPCRIERKYQNERKVHWKNAAENQQQQNPADIAAATTQQPHNNKKKTSYSSELCKPTDDAEWYCTVKDLRNNKAADDQNIISEFIKNGGELVQMWLRTIFDWILKNSATPQAWKRSRTTLLHKGGNPEHLDNYRGITVSSYTYRVFTTLLHRRMDSVAENNNILGPLQHGFRRNKRTTDSLFILNQILEKSKKGSSRILTVIDLRKAYDSVPRKSLWQVLDQMGFDDQFLAILKNLYTDCTTTLEIY